MILDFFNKKETAKNSKLIVNPQNKENSLGTTSIIKIPKLKTEKIKPHEGYFLVKIHSSQVAYIGRIWEKIQQLVVTSNVKLNDHNHDYEKIRSILRSCPIQKNHSEQLGLATNLIDLTPATMDKVSICIEFRLDINNKLSVVKELINSDAFISIVSLSPGAIFAAGVVSGITEKIINTFFKDGESKPILEFSCDLNITSGDLSDSYYVILGTRDDKHPLPRPLPTYPDMQINNLDLTINGKPVTDLSYIILDITVVKARSKEFGKGKTWYKKLTDAEMRANQIAMNIRPTNKERENSWEECSRLLYEANLLLHEDPLYHSNEVKAIIQTAYEDIKKKIYPNDNALLNAPSRISLAEASLLGVNSEEELEKSVMEYTQILKDSRQKLAQIGIL